ncbi:MAG TPA: S41 family peptidase [Candidatus Omnitrophota bacterium]|nr:S41 family peptidase [Candidatus Omnitrophota bacterium]
MKKINKIFLGVVLVACLVVAGLVQAEGPVKNFNGKELFQEVQLFADALTLINADYVTEIKVKDLVYGAIKGMVDKLDGYSQFLQPEDYKDLTDETRGEFGGIGIEVGVRKGILTIIAVMDDTPASAAGLKSQDKIVKIGDEITRDITLDGAVKKLRGKPGTKVNLSVVREGESKVIKFEIERAVIVLKSIKDKKIIEGDIGYIRIAEFQEKTGEDLEKAVKELLNNGAKSFVMDLRNNPGGLLDAAVDVSELFLEPGKLIVYTQGRTPESKMEFRSKNTSGFKDMPIVVVVDAGSASAAEIFAGAMKDNKRALIIGERTFGKGSVQTVIPLRDGAGLRLTTANYFTPSGKNINEKGVDPDITVKYVAETGGKKPEDLKSVDEIFEELEVEKEDAKRNNNSEKITATNGKLPEKIKDKTTPAVTDNNQSAGTDKEGKKDQEISEYDNQLAAAINVLKGIKLYESYKSGLPSEGK